jgi:hypothetical protein
MPAPDWWNQSVMVVNRQHVSRKLLVLTAANKDGGAHVDEQLPPEYQALVDGFWTDASTGELISDHHALSLRQLGFELLNSNKLVGLTN